MSLYKQLLIGICLFTLVIFCGNFFVSLESSREQYRNQLTAHAQDAATALGVSLTAHVDDPVMTELMVNAIFDSGYFYRIRVMDVKTGKTLIERSDIPQSARVPAWFVRLVRLDPGLGDAIIMRGWTQAARVEVISHPMFALARLWQNMVASFLWLIGCSLLCVLAATLLLRRSLRPLNDIVKQAMAICRREFLTLTELPKTPELRRVVEATNLMVSQLKALFRAQAESTEKLRAQAWSDSLTNLPNRRAFDIELQSRLSNEERTTGSLILLRVQDLIGLNQRLGGARADELLKSIAELLLVLRQRILHNDAFLARVRGGEFAIIAPEILPSEMETLLSALSTQLKALHETGLSDVAPAAYFARVDFHTGDTPQAVLSRADQALTVAETGGRLFGERQETPPADADRHSWHQRLEEALTRESFELFAQPVYQCGDRHQVLHHKILARVKTAQGETIPAASFIPWVHRLALGRRMDIVMLKQTLRQLERRLQPLALSISGESITDDQSLNALLRPLKSAPRLAPYLTLELDENELPDPQRVNLLVQRLRQLGCRLGIQHFGGRFHLIGNLPQWGLAWIKVDGGYIRNIDSENDKKLFIEAIYWATRQIDLPLIAERVETAGELAALEKIGLYGAMGRYFSDASTLSTS